MKNKFIINSLCHISKKNLIKPPNTAIKTLYILNYLKKYFFDKIPNFFFTATLFTPKSCTAYGYDLE